LKHTLELSEAKVQEELLLNKTPQSQINARGIMIVSTLTNSVTVPHKTPLAKISILEGEQNVEIFTLRSGQDSSEESFDRPYITQSIEHGRAALYRSQRQNTEDGSIFEAHDYYTKIVFNKVLNIQKITLKLVTAQDLELPPGIRVHIKEILLLE
jgi:hypothetical protein